MSALDITRVKLYPVMVRRRTGVANLHVIVRLEAGASQVGWGEMSDLSHLPMYQFDLAALEQVLNDLLAGQDARNLARLEDRMQRFYPNEGHKYSRSGLVRQGVDLALHDLVARAEGVPVYALLGGQVRDRLKVCYPIFRMRGIEEVGPNLDRVQSAYERGFDLIRVYVGANEAADRLFCESFVARFGGKVRIKSLDYSNLLGWRQCLAQAERLANVVEFMLVESPAPENDYDGLAEFRRRSRWAVSEHANHLDHAWILLHRRCVDILNVAPYVLGGLRASIRLIALAEAAHASVLLGTTQELDLGTAAVAHLGAVARVLDYPSDNTGPELYTDSIVKNRVRYEAGFLLVPDGPGLGLVVDEERLAGMATRISNPFGADLDAIVDRTPRRGK